MLTFQEINIFQNNTIDLLFKNCTNLELKANSRGIPHQYFTFQRKGHPTSYYIQNWKTSLSLNYLNAVPSFPSRFIRKIESGQRNFTVNLNFLWKFTLNNGHPHFVVMAYLFTVSEFGFSQIIETHWGFLLENNKWTKPPFGSELANTKIKTISYTIFVFLPSSQETKMEII